MWGAIVDLMNRLPIEWACRYNGKVPTCAENGMFWALRPPTTRSSSTRCFLLPVDWCMPSTNLLFHIDKQKHVLLYGNRVTKARKIKSPCCGAWLFVKLTSQQLIPPNQQGSTGNRTKFLVGSRTTDWTTTELGRLRNSESLGLNKLLTLSVVIEVDEHCRYPPWSCVRQTIQGNSVR